jgi:hypothetical protein
MRPAAPLAARADGKSEVIDACRLHGQEMWYSLVKVPCLY